MEAEVFLQGHWKNVEQMEENLCLEELEAFLKAGRDREHRLMKFYAAFKGVDLDSSQDNKERFDAVQRRVEAKLTGKSEEELEFAELGIDIVTE